MAITSTNPPHTLEKKRRRTTLLVVAIFVFLGIVYLIYWLGWGRFEEYTDDAYTNGNMIMLTPQIEGIVTTIFADNTQLVEAGQPIIEIDKHDFEIALEHAKAGLAENVRKVVQLFTKVQQVEATLEARKADLLRANLDYQHRLALVDTGGVAKEDFEHSETTLYAAYAWMVEAEEMLASAIAEVENTSLLTHPLIESAKAELKKAFLNLHRCTVLSPVRGIVSQRKAQVGEKVRFDDALLAIIPLDQVWVDANFREVQLKNLRIGQPAILTADMYGGSVKFHGTVVGLNPGTGSVFSILPPQNATGNWIKIIQRVPVKISIPPEELDKYPLVMGLSIDITVDTTDRSGLRLPLNTPPKAIYSTPVYTNELSGVDAMIEQIIAENSPDGSD